MNSKSILVTVLSLVGVVGAYLYVKNRVQPTQSESKASQIVMYNWSEYMDPAVLEAFEQETGIKVVEEIFDSNETVRAKLLAGADGYDVIVPSGVTIETLIREGLVDKIDPSKIPNLRYIDEFFRNLYFDPQNEYSVPYLWGSTGIGYRSDLVKEPVTGWGALFDPKSTAAHKGKISMLDDPRETIAAALQYLGFSINSTDPNEIEKAVQLLLEQRKFISRYDSEVYAEFLNSGDLSIAHGWAGTVNKAILKNPKIAYVVPKEGGIVGVDCLVIPKASKHKEEAHLLIDFILRPKMSAQIVNKTYYPSTNKGADPFIDPKIRKNRSIYPEKAAVERMEWLKDVGVHNELYERAWERIRFSR